MNFIFSKNHWSFSITFWSLFYLFPLWYLLFPSFSWLQALLTLLLSNSFRWQVSLFIWDFTCFLRKACTDVNFPHNSVCQSLSRVRLFATPWTVARQASLSMGFCRQEYWSGLPSPSPEELTKPGIRPWTPASQAVSLVSELQGSYIQLLCCMS